MWRASSSGESGGRGRQAAASLTRVPRGVWALGLVSLFMDTSSELIHALLPVHLVALGASMATVGLIEGIAEGTAACTKLVSGALSDWWRSRKGLVVAGYALAALTKPVFALAPSVAWIFAARFADRVGKGIRGAPRDALIADLTPPALLGASFGLRQSLDTVGAFLGPLLAVALMWLLAGNIRGVFGFAILPALLAVAILIVFVVEPPRAAAPAQPQRYRWDRAVLGSLGARFWKVIAVAAALSLARFSDAFLILKAQSTGLPVMLVPLVLVLMNVAYSAAAYPAGALSDRVGRSGLLTLGVGFLVIANVALALPSGLVGVAVGVVLWGLHLAFTQGLLASLVAEAAPEDLRGTAFGVLNVVTGVALVPASLVAGVLWDFAGPVGTFAGGAALAALPFAALLVTRSRRAA